MRRVQIIGALCLAVVGCLVGAVGANAAPSDPFVYKGSFGEGLTTTLGDIVVNYQTGNILAMGRDGNIHQFDASGNPANFPSTGSPEIPGTGQLVIDNSGGATQGNFYVWDGTFLYTHHADGSPIGESTVVGSSMGPGVFQPSVEGTFLPGQVFEPVPLGIFIQPDGTLWAYARATRDCYEREIELVALTPEAAPTGHRAFRSCVDERFVNFPSYPTPVVGRNGTLYVSPEIQSPVFEFDSTDDFKNRGSISSDAHHFTQFAIDPATDDFYAAGQRNSAPVGFVSATHPNSTGGGAAIPVLTAAEGLGRVSGIAFDGTGQTLYVSEETKVDIFHRESVTAPRNLTPSHVTEVSSRSAVLESSLIDGGGPVSYRFEYGTTTSYGGLSKQFTAPRRYYGSSAGGTISGLEPNTTYHVRLVATNVGGTTYGPDGTFRTYPEPAGGIDPCPNALARKQTIAQRLPDCRAYELASAADTGGYDVESYLAPGQTPFPGFPMATDKLLYATHSGAVPGPWNATNKGPDPYVATRTANGWVTDYKGLPSNLNPAAGSFSSVLGEADSSLSTLAFAGPNLCDPCFTGAGLRTGIPVRLPSGQLVQGMAGSLSGSVDPSAKPEGKVARYFSQDGKKLFFASKYAFEPGANNNGSDLTVYERDLAAGTTEIVSTDPAGNALSGEGISELDVSADGSRVAIGKKVSADSQGNEYVHPYLHIVGRPGSIDLAPTATSGVLYAGMSSDGSKVFFATADKLDGADTDESADLYEADVDASGNLALKAITADNDSDACSPVANEAGEHWNTTGSNVDCSAVTIGGGGVASQTGAAYFLSPEQFGGQGTLNQPNLYLAQPSGQISLVATLEPNNPLVLDSVKANATRNPADFQTTPSGNYAAFTSKLVLAGLHTGGFASVYRFAAGSGQLDCASCDRTEAEGAGVFADADLPPDGLALLGDGRLFFTTVAQRVVNDPNGKKDVYEWIGGGPQLISAGTGPFDSALLTVSSDGTDVFFFTHDNLAPDEDRNGALMRVYDAREGGGAFRLPASIPCQASDECHGPGTPQPGPADIKSSGKTTQGNVIVCAKNRVKKRGQCVKKKHKKHAKKKRKGGSKQRAAAANGKRGGRNA